MLRGISNIYIPSVSHQIAQGGRMSFHVDSASIIYSHFQYVSGTLAPEGTNGVTISKLNLLDVLIGRLNQLNNTSLSSAIGADDGNGFPASADIDGLIDSYTQQLQEAQAASQAMPYLPAPNTMPGGVLSILS